MSATLSPSSSRRLSPQAQWQMTDADFAIDDASTLMLRTLASLSNRKQRHDDASVAL
jgi:hypothetical protein